MQRTNIECESTWPPTTSPLTSSFMTLGVCRRHGRTLGRSLSPVLYRLPPSTLPVFRHFADWTQSVSPASSLCRVTSASGRQSRGQVCPVIKHCRLTAQITRRLIAIATQPLQCILPGAVLSNSFTYPSRLWYVLTMLAAGPAACHWCYTGSTVQVVSQLPESLLNLAGCTSDIVSKADDLRRAIGN